MNSLRKKKEWRDQAADNLLTIWLWYRALTRYSSFPTTETRFRQMEGYRGRDCDHSKAPISRRNALTEFLMVIKTNLATRSCWHVFQNSESRHLLLNAVCSDCMYVSAAHKGFVPRRSEKDTRFPRTWITDGCKPPCECQERNPGLLQEQQMFSPAVTSPVPHRHPHPPMNKYLKSKKSLRNLKFSLGT